MAQEITVALRLRDGLTGPIREVRRELSVFDRAAKSLGQRFGWSDKVTERVGRLAPSFGLLGGALTAVSLPMGALGVQAMRVAGDFEQAMNEVKAFAFEAPSSLGKTATEAMEASRIAAGRLESDMRALRARITRDIAPGTMFSETEFARAASKLAASGFRPAAIGQMLRPAALAATALQSSLEEAASGISNAAASFGYGPDRPEAFGGFAALYGVVSARTKADLQTLNEAFKYAGSVASALKFSKEGVAASAGFLANAGLQGSEIGTGLKAMMTRIGNWFSLKGPDTDDKKVFAKYGLRKADFFKQEGGISVRKDLDEILDMFSQKKIKAEDFSALFDLEHFGKPLVLQNSMGGVRALKEEARIAFAQGSKGEKTVLDPMADIMGGGLNAKLKTLSNAWQALARAVGDTGLLDAVTGLVQGTTKLVAGMGRVNPDLLQWGVVLGGVGLVLGPVLLGLGGLLLAGVALAPLLAEVGLTFGVLGFAALKLGAAVFSAVSAVWATVKNWDAIKFRATQVWDGIKSVAVRGWDFVSVAFVAGVRSLAVSLDDALTAFVRGVSARVGNIFGLPNEPGRVAEDSRPVSFFRDLIEEQGTGPTLAPEKAFARGKPLLAPASSSALGEALATPKPLPLSGRIEVDFRNAPTGTRVRAEAPRGIEFGTRLGLTEAMP